jgi:hypothetical protein
LEARGSPRWWCHGPACIGRSVRSRNRRSRRVIVFACDRVIDETPGTAAALVELGPKVLVVRGLATGLALIEILLVKGADPVGTLLGIVGRVLWGQRAHTEGQSAGVTVGIIYRIQVVRFFWESGFLVGIVGLIF